MANDSLQQAIALIKAGDKQNGRRLLADFLKTNPKNETAWLWLSSSVDSDEQRRYCLKQVLAINPANQLAQKGLVKLDPPKPSESLAPSVPPLQAPKPTALKPAPEAMPVPVKQGKDVWLNPNHLLNKIIVLYDEAVAAANPDSQTLKRIQAEAIKRTPDLRMLGAEVEVIPLRCITLVSTDKRGQRVTIRYKKENKPGLETLYFANSADRDEFFNALQVKLSLGFECVTKEFNPWQALLMPIVVMAGLGYSTYLCHGAALELQSGADPTIRGRYQLFKLLFLWLVTLIGPVGVIILGGLLLAVLLWWAVGRTIKPPIMMMLTPVKNLPPDQAKPEREPVNPELSTVANTQPPQPIRDKQLVQSPQKQQPLNKTLVRLVLLFFIVCSTCGILGLYLNGPTPGLIEDGMILDLSDRGLVLVSLKGLGINTYFFVGISAQGFTLVSLKTVPLDKLVLVDLSRNPLTELPPDIGRFSNIRALFIKETQLKKLPPEIGQLSKLEDLIIQDNQLIELPPEIGKLSNLKVLYVQNNKLTTLPPEIGRLPKLRQLLFYGNPISVRNLPPEIQRRLPELTKGP